MDMVTCHRKNTNYLTTCIVAKKELIMEIEDSTKWDKHAIRTSPSHRGPKTTMIGLLSGLNGIALPTGYANSGAEVAFQLGVTKAHALTEYWGPFT
jgi:hypothetical protein